MKYWLAVISLDHAKIAAGSSFLQVCHGKIAPLRRTSAEDQFFIYSPKTGMGRGESIMSITYRGSFDDEHIYQVEQSPDFFPYRKKVTFDYSFKPVPIHSIPGMEFTAKSNWGLMMRRGFIELSAADAARISEYKGN